MTEIITRVQYPALHKRMAESAVATAAGPVRFSFEQGAGSPRIAETYNRLADQSAADILVFCHDDVEFLSAGWDARVREALEFFEVVGVVGSQEYNGGFVFDAGYAASVGRIACDVDGRRIVKTMTNRCDLEPAKVLDGLFLAMRKRHFQKTRFDERFDGLFFYDADLCLRSKCAAVNVLLYHGKPAELRGVYPAGMLPMEHYAPILNEKHQLKGHRVGDQRCESVLLEYYK